MINFLKTNKHPFQPGKQAATYRIQIFHSKIQNLSDMHKKLVIGINAKHERITIKSLI